MQSGDVKQASVGSTYYVAYPDGGVLSSGSTQGSLIGYLKITLPVSWIGSMVNMTVDVCNYSKGIATYHIEGYAASNNQWGYHRVHAVGTAYPVCFGHDGEKCAIYIGSATQQWSYPKAVVRDIVVSFSARTYNTWKSGWNIEITPTLGTITATVDDPKSGNADMVDGNHIAVVSAFPASPDASTIYFTSSGIKYYVDGAWKTVS